MGVCVSCVYIYIVCFIPLGLQIPVFDSFWNYFYTFLEGNWSSRVVKPYSK